MFNSRCSILIRTEGGRTSPTSTSAENCALGIEHWSDPGSDAEQWITGVCERPPAASRPSAFPRGTLHSPPLRSEGGEPPKAAGAAHIRPHVSYTTNHSTESPGDCRRGTRSRRCFAVIDDPPANDGHHGFNVFDLVGRDGQVVAIEHEQVCEPTGLDRAQVVLLEHEVRILASVGNQSVLATD